MTRDGWLAIHNEWWMMDDGDIDENNGCRGHDFDDTSDYDNADGSSSVNASGTADIYVYIYV